MARRWGVTDEELLALARYQTSPVFSEVDKLVLRYAEGISRTPVDVPADLVELTHLVALENLRGRFNLALGIEAAGFSQGRVCALPTPQPVPAVHRSGDAPAGPAQDRRS